MKDFTKHNSNYIKSVRHQFLKSGSTIFERDWVTIGSQLNFGPNKIPYYSDGNFIFTTSVLPNYQKKYKNGVDVGVWTYDDVKNITSSPVNQILFDEYTEDIRTYGYYGSCVELVRSTIEDIINTFPGNITISNEELGYMENDVFQPLEGYYKLNNPFDINVFLKDIVPTKYDNELHYLTYSWSKYQISTSGEEGLTDIESYDVVMRRLYEKKTGDNITYQMFSDEEVEEGWTLSSCKMYDWLPINGNPVYTVTINGDKIIEGYIFEGEVVSLVQNEDFLIQPKEEVIEDYFNNLTGFKKQLLRRETKPLYTNTFVTPIEYSLGYLYYKRTYTWHSNGYCIDITSPLYLEFVQKLLNMAELFDELWTDNLWRRMTHEAIKNYDWTYTREYVEGDEEDNVDGGERMHKVINIIGRVFDDIKLKIDTIKRMNTLTYNGDRNMPSALISDKLEIKGWDIYSTIPTYIDEEENVVSASEDTITEEFLGTLSNETYENNWYPTLDPTKMSFTDVDIQFMRRLLLSTNRIFQTKGTRQSIDMVMGIFGYGENDYTITETYRTVTPRDYDEILYQDEQHENPYKTEYGEDMTFGDMIVQLNTESKGGQLLYDEDASGIPVGSFTIFKEETNTQAENEETTQEKIPVTYLIPFYENGKLYDGDLYFQSNGGWCYNMGGDTSEEEKIDACKWTETLSYLHVVSQVKDLLSVHSRSINNGDIYYVVNINDYILYTEEPFFSNFFVMEDNDNPELFSSWTNLNLEDGYYTEDNGFTAEEIERYTNYAKKAKYLDSIIPYNIGNNPHVGYGNYDMGENFFDYMKQPFKYSIDINNFETLEDVEKAEKITFDITDDILTNEIGDKIQVIKSNVDDNGKPIDYNLNSKVIYFSNNIDNNEYKNYFLNVIMKYLMQVIPSTAIFVLENFQINNES